MVTIRYEDGTGEPAEVDPVEFEYVTEAGYWLVVVAEDDGEDDGEERIKWLPRNRVYEIEGRRDRIPERLKR